jgi:hypothetical protein
MTESDLPSKIGFTLTIEPNISADGELLGYHIVSRRELMPQEVVLTLVSNWLRHNNNLYHQAYLGQNK